MSEEILVGHEAEINEGEPYRVTANDLDLCVVKVGGQICVIEDRCPHMSAPFSFGTTEGTVITCPQHRAQFDLASYLMVAGPQTGGGALPQQPQPTGPEAIARAERRRQMMSSVHIKPLVAFEVVKRDGDVYAVLPQSD